MIVFEDWNIREEESPQTRQFDDNSRTLLVVGDLPEGWEWVMLVRMGEHLNLFSLQDMEGGKGVLLRAQHFPVEGVYTLQLRGTKEDMVRHTNKIWVYIPASLSGNVCWPELPTRFTDLEQRVHSYAANPPYIGQSGSWWTWNGTQYEDSGYDVVKQLLAALPNGDEVTY